MDYSQILASQMVDKGAWTGNEDAFYDRLSLDGLAKMRGVFKMLKRSAQACYIRVTAVSVEKGKSHLNFAPRMKTKRYER